MFNGLTLPLARMRLGAPFCPRVVCSDAAPGGHGVAYTTVDPAEAQLWATFASHQGDYSALYENHQHMRIDPSCPSVMQSASRRWKIIAGRRLRDQGFTDASR